MGLIKKSLMAMELANLQLPFILAQPKSVSVWPKCDGMKLLALEGSFPAKVCFSWTRVC